MSKFRISSIFKEKRILIYSNKKDIKEMKLESVRFIKINVNVNVN